METTVVTSPWDALPMDLLFPWQQPVRPLLVWPDPSGPWGYLRPLLYDLVDLLTTLPVGRVLLLADHPATVPEEWTDHPGMEIREAPGLDPRVGRPALLFGRHGDAFCALSDRTAPWPRPFLEALSSCGVQWLPTPFPVDPSRLATHPTHPLLLVPQKPDQADDAARLKEALTRMGKTPSGSFAPIPIPLPFSSHVWPRWSFLGPMLLSVAVPNAWGTVARDFFVNLPRRVPEILTCTILVHDGPVDFLQLGDQVLHNTGYLERTAAGKLLGWNDSELALACRATRRTLHRFHHGLRKRRLDEPKPWPWKAFPGLRLSDLVVPVPEIPGPIPWDTGPS